MLRPAVITLMASCNQIHFAISHLSQARKGKNLCLSFRTNRHETLLRGMEAAIIVADLCAYRQTKYDCHGDPETLHLNCERLHEI